jgi:ferritin
MKLPPSVEDAINAQVRNELQSHYNYLGMSAHFDTTPYKGFAAWFRRQAAEEYGHATKLLDYLRERNGVANLFPLEAPAIECGDAPVDAFETALSLENAVTQQITDLYELAQKERDYTTLHFLSWFLQEQVEEENSVSDMIDRLRLVADNAAGLLRVDEEAGHRPAEG